MRHILSLIVIAAMIALIVGWTGYRSARADPVVRQARIALPGWPDGAGPVRAVLLSDIHIGNATMDRARLDRIVTQVLALRPDLVLIAGDFVAGHDLADAASAPGLAALGRLHPRFGVIAVPGNHDHWTDVNVVRAALEGAGVTVLRNEAVMRGPLVIGGVDDSYTDHARLPATLAAMASLPGAKVVLSHSPDIAPVLPAGAPLLLAGHTHCAQLYVPWLFQPRVPSKFGERYRCGLVREGARAIIITAGLGTSIVPLRFGAPADFWLLTLGPH